MLNLTQNTLLFINLFQVKQSIINQMHFQLLILLVLTTTLTHAQEPQIIDFTYTQLLEETNYAGSPKQAIDIEPNTRQFDEYQFPQVCELVEDLQLGTDSSGTVDHFINVDSYLQNLRVKILHLLKLAEEIHNSRSYLAQISKHLDMNEEVSVFDKFKSQLQSLAKRESQLIASRQKIYDLTINLNSRVNAYNNNPKNQQFKIISLNYNVENYHSKIKYLKGLKERSIAKASSEPHNNFTDFFGRLSPDLFNQTSQLDAIDIYFQDISHLNYLNDTANSLRDNIEVDKLNIQYKQSCANQIKQLQGKASTPSHIKETLDHLREKKKEFGTTSNKYCEGVALKLETQIKRLLRAINWTFMCADGLQDLILKVKEQERKLNEIQNKIKTFGTGGFNVYEKDLQQSQSLVKRKYSQLKDLTIDQFSHDPAQLDQLILEAERGRTQARENIRNLPQEVNWDKEFNEIKRMAEQLKRERIYFCNHFSPYQLEQKKVWYHINNYEQQARYSSKMREQFLAEADNLQKLQSQYKELSVLVTEAITDKYESK